MSDPLANVDIEDVLSSIRRLVSNGPDRADDPSVEDQNVDRLVLTPSQRVDEAESSPTDESEPETATTTVGAVGMTEAHPPGIDPQPVSAPAGDEPGKTARDAGPEPDTEAQDEAALAALLLETEGDADDPRGAEPTSDDGPADTNETAENGSAFEGIAAMFARHEAAAPDAWEPDGDDEDAFADRASSSAALDWCDTDMADDASVPRSSEAEPESPGAGAHGRARDDGHTDEMPPDEDNAFAIENEDEAVLDEVALRDLVAEIVREELMGTLGERITRNVRTLVRREIHRALNSQDFD
jgi:hypothetical protein